MTNTIPTATKKKIKGRTFQCTGYPDCNMTFTRSEHLARHIRKHTGERPFECVHCSRKFSRLDNLRQHKQTVHAHEHEPIVFKDGQPVGDGLSNNNNNNNNNDNERDASSIKSIKIDDHNHTNNNNKIQDNSKNENEHHPHQRTEIYLQESTSSSDLPAAATNLLRPTQFRSKHRPRPIALPSRKSIYNDAPYTVPTPRSANSTSSHLLLSPISPANSLHAFNYQNNSSQLPSVQFLTTNGSGAGTTGDSLISPYNSSFSSNFSISNANTPTNTSFDSTSNLRTPTTHVSGHYNYDGYLHTNQQHQQQQGQAQQGQQQQSQPSSQQLPQRRSWLNNVLNNETQSNSTSSNGSNNNNTTTTTTTTSSKPSQYNYQYQHNRQPSNELQQNNRVRIENLLNSSSSANSSPHHTHSTNYNSNHHGHNNIHNHQNHYNENERVKLPHVKHLGIDISKN